MRPFLYVFHSTEVNMCWQTEFLKKHTLLKSYQQSNILCFYLGIKIHITDAKYFFLFQNLFTKF